jgi:hypothetical protein
MLIHHSDGSPAWIIRGQFDKGAPTNPGAEIIIEHRERGWYVLKEGSTMPKFNLSSTSSLLDIIDGAAGPEEIADAFPYVTGYLVSLLEGRIEKEEDPALKKLYQKQLDAVDAGWEAFHRLTPTNPRAAEIHERQTPKKPKKG